MYADLWYDIKRKAFEQEEFYMRNAILGFMVFVFGGQWLRSGESAWGRPL